MYFLIDYENVNYAGLEGTEFLEKGDTISFFFSEKCDKIVGYRMMDIDNSGCTFEICKLKNIRKNALDFYIASKVGEIFAMDCDAKIAIISVDKDHQSVIDYWKPRLAVPNQLVRTKTIAKAIRDLIRANGQKGILDIDAQTSAQVDFQQKLQTLMNTNFKQFFEASQAVLPLTQGYKYTDVTKTSVSPTPADLNERINYEFEMAGRAFRIPKALMLGDVSDVATITKNFLTFAIDPIAEKFGEEATRKRYGAKQFAKGNYIDVNTNCIQHIDIFEQATNSDKLLASGIYCIDEIRTKLGDTAVGEEWSRKHYITKNYAEADQMDHLGEERGQQ